MDPCKIPTNLESIKGNLPLPISLYLAAVVGNHMISGPSVHYC
jgi:hypothetical protein